MKEKGFAPLERVPFNVCLRPPSQAMSLDPAVAVASRWTMGLGPPSIDAPAEDFWLIRLAKLEEDVVCVNIESTQEEPCTRATPDSVPAGLA